VSVHYFRSNPFPPAKLGAGSRNYAFDIHLRSLTTNEIHPDAARSILRAFENEYDSAMGNILEKLQIIGDYVILQCRDPMDESTCVQMWDWKCREGYEVNHCYSFSAPD
jgi:hypothetical protein